MVNGIFFGASEYDFSWPDFAKLSSPPIPRGKYWGLKTGDSLFLVRELGFANIAIGSVATASLKVSPWWPAAATAGAIFYGLAGCSHVFQPRRNQLENVAMVSDLFAAVVLLGVLAAYLRR